ncbi:hypothetical protein LWI29_037942 [Acer saccharum]|uniref:Uncharacterized protein n=1 Tax=Acer saccharum TaxID=4024 RepID=A0AA39TMJ6_ACESA|nr:hypothetical protein LWI29_037942 [Acer saccharum]
MGDDGSHGLISRTLTYIHLTGIIRSWTRNRYFKLVIPNHVLMMGRRKNHQDHQYGSISPKSVVSTISDCRKIVD